MWRSHSPYGRAREPVILSPTALQFAILIRIWYKGSVQTAAASDSSSRHARIRSTPTTSSGRVNLPHISRLQPLFLSIPLWINSQQVELLFTRLNLKNDRYGTGYICSLLGKVFSGIIWDGIEHLGRRIGLIVIKHSWYCSCYSNRMRFGIVMVITRISVTSIRRRWDNTEIFSFCGAIRRPNIFCTIFIWEKTELIQTLSV